MSFAIGRRVGSHYPSWQQLEQRDSRWSRVRAAILAPRNMIWLCWLLGLPLLVYSVIISTPPDFAIIDTLMERRSFTFYSDQALPRVEGEDHLGCVSSVAGERVVPDDYIAVEGVSMPDVASLIECAKGELAATRDKGEAGDALGSSRNLIDALIAQEDRYFWSGKAPWMEFLRGIQAYFSNRGGSNVPMQLIKNVYFRLANTAHERDLEKYFRNFYARQHQGKLEEHVRSRLAAMRGVKPSSLTVREVRTAILALYLQTAHTVAPDKSADPDEAKRLAACTAIQARLQDVLDKNPQCLDYIGVRRVARSYYGKRLDQLTLAESASVVAALRGGTYGIWPNRANPPPDCRASLKSNKCWAGHILRVMANDRRALGLESGWWPSLGSGRLFIPVDQLPEELKRSDVPFITPSQLQAAQAELKHLVVCGQEISGPIDQATRLAIVERRRWCPAGGEGSGRSDALGKTLASYLEPELLQANSKASGEIAVYTSLDPVAQRAAEAALRTAPGGVVTSVNEV